MKNLVSVALKTSVTAFLFYLLFSKVDFHQFGETLRNARVDILLASFVLLWVGHYICIFRWRMLMRPLMPAFPLFHLFGIYCIGLFFNLTFPTVVGGDVVKMYYAGKPSRRYAQSFAATFLDRDSGMFAMMLIACTGVLIHPVEIPGLPVALIIWPSFAAFILLNIAVFTPGLHRQLTSMLRALHLGRIAAKIDTVSDAFQTIWKHKGVLVGSLAISIVNQLLVISYTWILARGLHVELSLLYFIVLVPIITLISMIPISLNGMGLREYAFLSLLGAVGVPAAASVALGLLTSASIVLSAVPGGILYIFFRDRRDLQKMAALESDFS